MSRDMLRVRWGFYRPYGAAVGTRSLFFFFFNDPATTEIYTLSLHDALPICRCCRAWPKPPRKCARSQPPRSEEHTSELQSHLNLVCRLLLEKKKIWRT